MAQTQAKLALHRIDQKVAKLHHKRLVQPQVAAQLRNLIGPRILPEQKHHRVAHILEQHERNESDHPHHHQGLGESAQDEGEHVV